MSKVEGLASPRTRRQVKCAASRKRVSFLVYWEHSVVIDGLEKEAGPPRLVLRRSESGSGGCCGSSSRAAGALTGFDHVIFLGVLCTFLKKT